MLDGMDQFGWVWPAGGFVAAAALASTVVMAALSLRRMGDRDDDADGHD
ncbi:MAG: hypothetical protein JWP66_1951 [Naasia sp.]|nr:hypothetical protein [Naasia sp.]